MQDSSELQNTGVSVTVDQAAEGDTEALTFLLGIARPVIYDWASQMTGDPDAAEDITQAALIRVWKQFQEGAAPPIAEPVALAS